MQQNNYARKKRQLKGLAKSYQNYLTIHGHATSGQLDKIVLKIKTLLNELIYAVHAADLKKLLGGVAICLGVSFTNQTSAQSFSAPQPNPFGLDSVFANSPDFTFADLDNDGDMDLLVGEYYGNLQYFENTGSANNPQFAVPQVNSIGLDSTYGYAAVTFSDLDDDGDLDLMVGEYYGALKYFENTGTATDPQFAAPQVNPFGLDSTYGYAAVSFTDLDDDGDVDLLVGESGGNLKYFQNTGSANNPQFAAPQTNPFGLSNITSRFSIGLSFADLDDDGDMDLLVGEYYGALQYFQNTGSANNPQFAAPQTNPFGLDSVYSTARPAFVDLDGDGDVDLLVGEYYSSFQYFENTQLGVGIAELPNVDKLMLFPNPVNNVLNIKSDQEVEKIEIFDMLGKSTNVKTGTSNRISVGNLATGMHTAKITYSNGEYVIRKFLKE